MKASEKISKARAGLVLDQPFFGSLALRLRVVKDSSCPTAWTNGEQMGYNPEFIEGLTLDETKGLICHEVMHCACAHMARRGNRDHRKWNIAGDYAINQIIEEAGMTLPAGRLFDPAYAGMSADEIYNRLPQPDASEGSEGSDGSASSDPGGCGEVRDAQGRDGQPVSPADLSQAEENWKIATAQAAQAAKRMGKLPAGLDRLVTDILAPKVDWREVLRRFVDLNARNDYRWFPPNRRYIHQGIYMPSVRSEVLPPVVIAVDTSGSIGQDEISQFAGEMTAILEEHPGTPCTVLYCDAEIANVEEFTTDDLPLRLNPKGGGGTDFRPAFKWVTENGLIPSCMIYLTDMDGTFPDMAPDYPVLWTKIGKSSTNAPFGEEVHL